MIMSDEKRNLQRDLRVLQEYVREDLFYSVKFVYNVREDLKEGGLIFNDFKRKRFDEVGKHLRTDDSKGRDTYFLLLWKVAEKEKVIVDGLSTKRSSVYAIMFNRFEGEFP